MKDTFYIVCKDNWYRLHIKDTHYCIGGCPSPEPLLKTVRRLIKKYRTKSRLFNALSHQEDKGLVNKKMTEKYAEEYELYSEDCDDILTEVVEQAVREVKEDTPFKRSQRILNKVKSKKTETTGNTSDSSHLETTENTTTEVKEKVRPRLLRKKRLLLR